jgi:hypothetical protein
MQDAIYKYLNSKQAQKDLKNLTWVAFTDKYKATNLCFKNGNFNIEANGSLRPDYFPSAENIVKFYDLLGTRIELALNLVKGKTNKELEKQFKGLGE